MSNQRKPNRINDYDYSQNGAYFITLCSKDRANIFGNLMSDVGDGLVGANCVRLQPSNTGQIVQNEIENFDNIYENVYIECSTIMPNHIHLIIMIDSVRQTQFAPTISTIIKQFKGKITKEIGYSIWQKSFYDHIIRGEHDFQRIYEYIKTNPLKWELDEYYT